jgi:hypothetical protein
MAKGTKTEGVAKRAKLTPEQKAERAAKREAAFNRKLGKLDAGKLVELHSFHAGKAAVLLAAIKAWKEKNSALFDGVLFRGSDE